MSQRVWVTGLGVVCSLGKGVTRFFEGLLRGESALSPVEGIPIARGKRLGGQVKEPEFEGPHHLSLMAREAVAEALAQAGLPSAQREAAGLYLGTVASEGRIVEDHYDEFHRCDRLSPELRDGLLRYTTGALADLLAAEFGLGGPRDVNTNACASGNIALARALMAIRLSRVKSAVVCGADQLRPIMYWAAERAGLMGHDLRPFHKERNGTVFGDGVGVMVLEDAEVAQARGASPLAELAGWGVVCDENPQLILPQQDGGAVTRSVLASLADADVAPEEVDYINAHGTGTVNIDRIETLACKQVFGERAGSIPVNSTKSLTGHLSAASPLVEGIATVLAISRSYIHPTAKLDQPDPALGLDYVPLQGRHQPVRCALSNSMGGGGTNATVVFTRCGRIRKPRPEPLPLEDVVITGVGALSSFGVEPGSLVRGLQESASIPNGGRIEHFDIRAFVPEEPQYQHYSRTAQLALVSAIFATADADLPTPFPQPDRLAVVFGTEFGGTSSWGEMLGEAYQRDPRQITPNMALEHGHHLGVTLIARRQHSRGPNCTLTGGRTAGLEAIGFGAELIRAGVCDAVLVGGADSLDRSLERALTLLGCARDSAGPVTPYLGDAAGFRPAEGAACLVLERRATALARGARVRGFLRGFGSAADPVGVGRYDPNGRALLRAMREATANAGGAALVLGVGDGSRADLVELRAFDALRRESSLSPVLTSLAGRIGQTFAAGSVLSVVAGLHALSTCLVPNGGPVHPLSEPFAVPGACFDGNLLLVNAVAPGGAAASLFIEASRGGTNASR